MQRMRIVFALLCATALLATAAWSIDLPFYNQSFETYEMLPGANFEPGYDYSGSEYPWPVGFTWSAYVPLIQSLEVAGAPDGDRVLLVQNPLPDATYHYSAGIWGTENGIPYTIVPDGTYTFSVKCSKAPGLANDRGLFKIVIGNKGTWEGSEQSVEFDIPQQTQEGVWTTYSVTKTFDLESYPGAETEVWGKYIGLIMPHVYGLPTEAIGLYYDDITIDGPISTIVGTVTLSDWSPADPDKGLTPVKIELIPQGSGFSQTELIVLDQDDKYRIECAPGLYNVSFTAAGWLKKVETNVEVLLEGETVRDVVLINGDVNGDNQIDTPDYDTVSGNFDQQGD